MKKTLLAAASLCALATAAHAQSSPNWGFGKVPTAGEWNTAFSKKQDYLGYRPLSTGGGSMTGKLYLFPSTNSSTGLNFGQGSAPGAPSNGDMWMTSQGLFYQANGATVGPISTGGGGGAATFGLQTDQLTVTATNVLTTLSKSSNGQYIALIVNSNTYYPPAFTVSGGNTLNWTGAGGAAGFDLNIGDTVFAVYTATAVPVVPTLGGGVSSALQASTNTPGGLVALDGSGRINLSALLSFGTSLVGTAGQANVIRLYDTGSAATAYGLGLSSGSLNIVSGNILRNWASGVDAFDISSSAVTANVPIYGQLGTLGAAAANIGYAPSTLVADGYAGVGGSITTGTNTFSATRACVSGDIGKIIVIAEAGASGGAGPLKTTVTACSGSNYTLAANAINTVSNMQWGIVSDQSAALNSLVAANPGKMIVLPAGIIGLDATQITLSNIKVQGQGAPANRTAAYGANANQGTTFLMLSQTVQPFKVEQSVSIDGVNFFWPGQSVYYSSPVVYPALFMDDGVNQLSDFDLTHSSVINAYDMFVQNSARVVMGGAHFDFDRVYAIHYTFSLANVGETIFVNGSLFNPSVYAAPILGGNHALGIWTAGNGEFLHVFGNGTITTCSSTLVGGFIADGGTTINGVNYVVHAVNGSIDEVIFSHGTDVNGVQSILYTDQGSRISRTSFGGRMYPNGNLGVYSTNPAFDVEGNCTGGASATTGDVKVTGDIIGAQGSVFAINGTNTANFDVVGSTILNYDANTPSSPNYLAKMNAGNTAVHFTGVKVVGVVQGINTRGIYMQGVKSLDVTGGNFDSIYNVVDTSAITSGTVNIAGNTATNTTSTYTLAGAAQGSLASIPVFASGNKFDKPNPVFDALVPPTAVLTISQLPTCNANTSGMRAYVSDFNGTPTYSGSAGVGGGTFRTWVYCDGGGAWRTV